MSEGVVSTLKEFKLDFDNEREEDVLDSRELEPGRRRLPSNPDDLFDGNSTTGSSLMGFHSTPSDHSGRRREIQLQGFGPEEKTRMAQVAPLSQMLTFLCNTSHSTSIKTGDIETSTPSSVVEQKISMQQDSLLGPAPAVVDELGSSEPGVRSKRSSFFRRRRPKSFGKQVTLEATSKSQSWGNESDNAVKKEEESNEKSAIKIRVKEGVQEERSEGNSSSGLRSRSSSLWRKLRKATLSGIRENRSLQNQDKMTLVGFFVGEGDGHDKKGACVNDTVKKKELTFPEMEEDADSTPTVPTSSGLGLRGKLKKHLAAASERLQGVEKFDATTIAFFGIEGDSNQDEGGSSDAVDANELEWYDPFPTDTTHGETLEKCVPLPKSILKVKTSDLVARERWDLDAVLHPPNAPSPCRALRDSSRPASGPGIMSVKFSNVEVREYVRIIGDNPSTNLGPPLAIGWCYRRIYEKSVDLYESSRTYRKNRCSLQMDPVARQVLLTREWNVTATELLTARREVDMIRTQRMETVEEFKNISKAAFPNVKSCWEKKEGQTLAIIPFTAEEV